MNGTHLPEKNNSHVEQINFQNGTMRYIPNGIGEFFYNLKNLIVGDIPSLTCLGTKAVTRLNFKNLTKLRQITFVSNHIERLDKDALWDLAHLEIFGLTGQNLSFLNVRTFERNTKLKHAAVFSTGLRDLYENVFRYNLLLESVYFENNVIEGIHGATFLRNTKLGQVSLRSNKLKSLPTDLFNNNPLLFDIDFSENSLDYIKTNFTKLTNVQQIFLEYNTCIDVNYEKTDNQRNQRLNHRHVRDDSVIQNLTQFQNMINVKCG